MFNHQDVLRTASFQAQLYGSKRWHLCSPTQSPFLYGAGTLDTFDPDYDKYPMYEQARCFEDIIQPGEVGRYQTHARHALGMPSPPCRSPLLSSRLVSHPCAWSLPARPWFALAAAQVVFYPGDWWHQTENHVAPSVALTSTIMDQNNVGPIIAELEQECERNKFQWGFTPELCASLRGACFDYWRAHFAQRGERMANKYAADAKDGL